MSAKQDEFGDDPKWEWQPGDPQAEPKREPEPPAKDDDKIHWIGPSDPLDLALKYAALGFRIVPQDKNKKPCITEWPTKASSDPEQIRTWSKQFPKANWAVHCGASGLCVADVDVKNGQPGRESLKRLQQDVCKLPATMTVRTPSTGGHVYFRAPEDLRDGKPATIELPEYPGIEFKRGACLITLPGSTYSSGASYDLVGDHEIAPMPADLVELLKNGSRKRKAAEPGDGEKIAEPGRNTYLLGFAGRLRRGGAEEDALLQALLIENEKRCDPPLPEEEVQGIARSVAAYPAGDPAGELVKDYGHAAVLAKHFTERLRWAPHRGRWMRWTGKVWDEEEEERVAKVSADKLRKEYAEQIGLSADKATLVRLMALVRDTCVYSKIIAALSFLKGWEKILTRTAEWDRHPWLLNVGNGILDLKTGSLGGHDPAILLTKLAPTDFDPDAEGPTWQAHLERFLPNENIRRQVQRDLGLALVGTTIDEILPIWYGLGGNGKSTTTLVLRNVLENYTSEAAPNLLVLQKFEKHPTEIAELSGRRIIFSSEIGQGKRLDEQRVKELTGGGQPKRAHFMRQDNFDVEQTFTIFMLVNYHPVITGTDHAIWRRVRLIPWTVQISEAEKLPQDEIVKRLSAEGPAILAWLVAGLMDWQKDRNWIAPEVKAATTAFRAEQDRLGAFIEDTCEEAPHYTVPVGELYEKYTTWCSEVGEEALGKTAFGNRLKGGGKAAKRTGHENVWTWFGLRLKRELRLGATQSTNSPLELELVGGEQVKKVAESRKDLQFVDTEALKANAEKLAKYLNDDTIPLEMRNKRSGEYTVLVDEIAAREKVEK